MTPSKNPQFSSEQFNGSVVSNSLRPQRGSMPGLSVHHQLPESTQTHVHWVGDAIQPSHPLSFPSPPALNLSQHQGLFKHALRIRWPEYWSFSFNISPSSEHSGLISFRMDWLDLLAVQGTLKSLPQHHSSKASILSLKGVLLVDHTSYVLSHAVPGTMTGCPTPLVDKPGNSCLISPIFCLTPYTPLIFFLIYLFSCAGSLLRHGNS